MRQLLGTTAAVLLLLAAPLGVGPLASSTAHAQDAGATSQASGIVRVTSPRPGSTVWIDNEIVGQAPITRYLSVGPHTIRVAADGFDPDVRRVVVEADKTIDVTPQLIPGTGTVEFQATPGTARLVINDRDVLPLPMRLDTIAEGAYEYRFEADGYEPEEGSFTFTKGKNLLITARLKSSAGLVEVVTRPEGARVWVDGETVGASPVQLEGVEPGVHSVRIELKGYATVFERIDTSDGQKGSVDLKLRDEGANFVISTSRTDASVTIDGVEVGTGSTIRVPSLAKGRYLVEVSAPGHQTAEAKISVPASGRSAWKTSLKATGDKGESLIKEVVPLHKNWLFWAGVGGGAAVVTTGSIVAYNAMKVDPIPEGDITTSTP